MTRYDKILTALRDGPLTPAQLRAATGLTKDQIGKAIARATDDGMGDTGRQLDDLVCYDRTRKRWLIPRTPGEFARTQIPNMKGQVTRCDHGLNVLDAAEAWLRARGESPPPDLLRSRYTLEAHRDYALTLLTQMRTLAEAE